MRITRMAPADCPPVAPPPRPLDRDAAPREGTRRTPPPAAAVTQRLLVETVSPGRHVIFNPLSGAVDGVDDRELARIRALQRGEHVLLTRGQREELRARAYLFDTPAQEEAFLEDNVSAAWARMRSAQPAAYTVCPTLACNLACSYCFEGDSLTDKAQGVLSDAQVDAVLVAIAGLEAGNALEADGAPPGTEAGDARARGGPAFPPWISLFGGEPLLPSTRRCVARLLAGAADGGFLVGATTNGVNVARYADLLREYADILTVFQVTLDGPQAVHDRRRHRLGGQGTFAEVVRGIDLLLDLGIDVDLRVNVDAGNLPSLPELVDFLYERGWDARPGFQLALAPVTDHSAGSGHGAGTGPGAGGGCAARSDRALSEMEMTRAVLALLDRHPRMAELCHLGFLRHLDHLVSVLEPGKHRGRKGTAPGPRYWYCEASSDRQFVFTPEGLIYSCTEAVGKPRHAIGRFDPALDLWGRQSREWVGRTILSHPKCRACPISTLCGGGCNFAARERAGVGGGTPPGNGLMQIAVGGRGPRRPAPAGPPEPFCNAAEETVRAYLRHAGARLGG